MDVLAIAKESMYEESQNSTPKAQFGARFWYLVSRDFLGFSWRSDDEVNIRHLLVVEHESISEHKQTSVSEEHQWGSQNHLAVAGATCCC